MRILLFGKNGQLGGELTRQLEEKYEVISLGRDRADLANSAQITALAEKHHPQVLVNAAAYTAVDKAESEPEIVEIINSAAPGIMAQSAKDIGALLIHYSTDYVFDGNAREPYTENQPTNPQTIYGQTKLGGEAAVQNAGGKFLILRTSWLYARHGNNFLSTMLRLGREREELRIVNDQQGAPTYVPDLADHTAQLIDRYSKNNESIPYGIYHASGGGITTWYEFARRIFELSGIDHIKLTPISTAEYPTPAKRPLYSVLSNNKLKNNFGLVFPQWQDALTRCLLTD